jgi:glycosidase
VERLFWHRFYDLAEAVAADSILCRQLQCRHGRKECRLVFNTYRRLLALRQSEPALRDGTYQAINEDDPNVFAYVRKSGGSTILVALNMSAEARTITVNLDHASTAKSLYRSPDANMEAIQLNHLTLPPFGVLVARVR